MPVSVSSQNNPYVDKLIVDTTANATAEDDVLPGAGTVYIVDIDNTNNSIPAYAKLFNSAPTEGTTEPSMMLKAPKNVRQTVTITEGIAFSSQISFMCVSGSATNSLVAPTNNVTVRIMAE